MKSPSLDNFYAKIDRLVRLAQSYTESDGLAFIIKACRLKPYQYVTEDKSEKLVLHRWWFDEYGNSLRIVKNKRIKITYNDLDVDRKAIVCTDLYHGLSIERVARISKLVYLYVGKEEDLYNDCAIITFLGLDNYFRSYVYLYDEWCPISSLVLGMKTLKLLAKHLDIKYFINLGNKEKLLIPCISGEAWISYLPPSKEFTSLVGAHIESIVPLLNTKET
jgi:hypothetical protein